MILHLCCFIVLLAVQSHACGHSSTFNNCTNPSIPNSPAIVKAECSKSSSDLVCVFDIRNTTTVYTYLWFVFADELNSSKIVEKWLIQVNSCVRGTFDGRDKHCRMSAITRGMLKMVFLIKNPQGFCTQGDYQFDVCNEWMECASLFFKVDSSFIRMCAEMNVTFVVTDVIHVSNDSLYMDDLGWKLLSSKRAKEFAFDPTEHLRQLLITKKSHFQRGMHTSFIVMAAMFSLLAMPLVGFACWFRYHRKKRNSDPHNLLLGETPDGLHKSSEGSYLYGFLQAAFRREQRHSQSNPVYVEWVRALENQLGLRVFKSKQLFVVRQIGEGAFGRVYLVKNIDRMVPTYSSELQSLTHSIVNCQFMALKQVKVVSASQLKDLEREAETMHTLQHENIVKLLGVTLKATGPEVNGRTQVGLLFEYMEHGNLVDYLRSRNTELIGSNATPGVPISELLRFAYQISCGLEYLSSRHLVHRDIAARNCLIGADLNVKLSDFGMTRDLYTTDYYRMGKDTLVPLRWLSPESVLFRKFTIESDVWSFGVLLWEIFSFGMVPWYMYSNSEVLEVVKDGSKRLEKPDFCPTEIYTDIMMKCWSVNQTDRPSAGQARQKLAEFIRKEKGDCAQKDVAGSISEKEPDGVVTKAEESWPNFEKEASCGISEKEASLAVLEKETKWPVAENDPNRADSKRMTSLSGKETNSAVA